VYFVHDTARVLFIPRFRGRGNKDFWGPRSEVRVVLSTSISSQKGILAVNSE
jgi:hypothetical protein